MTDFDLHAFLRNLWSQGVELWLEGDQLRFKGGKHLMAGKTLKTLRENKQAIIDLLEKEPLAYSGFPLSHGQRGIYLMQSMAPESVAYNQACLLKLNDELDIPLLESSLDSLLQRHAPLRMSIKNLDGHIAQQVSFSLPSILSVETISSQAETGWQHWLDNEADRPFQLSNEPLIRAKLLVTASRPAHYYLLLVVHHIVADFWALNLIIRELESIYLAGITHKAPELPEINRLYKDYVIEEQEWLQGEQGQAAREYWHKELTPLPPALELPADFPKPRRPSFNGQEISFLLGETLTRQLKAAAKDAQVTPFVWVLSCYQLLLHRYTGENDIAIGSPVACRNQKDYQLLAGHFTNPVVLRARLDGNTAFHSLLEHNKSRVLQAMKHQQYPLQTLIEELQPDHQLGSSPLFQVAISWNQLNDNHGSSGRLIDDVVRMEQRGAIYQLVLTCYDSGDDIRISWRFSSDRHKARSIERLHRHLLNTLRESCANPQQNVSTLPFLADDELALIQGINNTEADYPKNRNLAELFRQNCRKQPQQLAFRDVDSNTNYSYSELDHYSDQLAHHLTNHGFSKGQHLVLCLPRGYDMLATLMACLKAGIVYIPLDPAMPVERLRAIAETAGALALVHDNKELDRQTGLPPLLALADIKPALPAHQPFALADDGHVDDDQTACIFFTSGSTGTPKGVEVPHRAPARLVLNTNYLTVEPGQRFCHFSNVSFDASNIEIWGALLNGASLLCIGNDTLLDPQAFARFVKQEGPDIAFVTTSLFNLLVQENPAIFRDFSCLMFGGEAADNQAVDNCLAHGRPQQLYNAYGPTENGSLSTAFAIREPVGSQPLPIGFVLSNNQAWIHDAYGNLSPVGVTGELMLGGDGVATGYIGQPALTAEKFITDPYRGKGLLYRTGDLAWLRDDGMIVYAGRRDDLVKIRGFRIELSEIEQALNQHPAILLSTVVVNRELAAEPLLAAYYVADQPLPPTELQPYLRRQLPAYMLPAALMQLPQLPLNANGKIDKRRLPQPVIEHGSEYTAPRNSQEQWMAAIWQDILGVSDIGIHDNFFDMGGHSLLAVRLAAAIQERWHHDVNMRLIFENPDIASLVEALGHDRKQQLPEITRHAADNRPVPASLSQQRLWFLQQLAPQSTAYNMPLALRFNEALKPSHVSRAICRLLQHHESLRTSFADHEGEAVLMIDDWHNWQLPTLDFSRLAPDTATRNAREQINLLANEAFDLARGPLFRALLIKLPGRQSILAFCLHHIIIDGWSVELLLQELGQLLANPDTDTLPAPELQYSDFSLWQHGWLGGELLQGQLDYWRRQLAAAPALINLPTDKPRPAVLSQNGASCHFTIPQASVTGLKNLARQQNASLFMVMMAAFSALLCRYSGQQDICVGFPISGRNHKALQPLIGLFVNNLVIRSRFEDNPDIIRHIANVRQTTLDAYANQDVPFDLIIDALKLERSLSYTPLLQVSFALESGTLEERIRQSLGDKVNPEPLDWHIAKYDLNLTCHEGDGDMQATLEYSTDLYNEATVSRLAQHYCHLLEQILDKPDQGILDLPLLTLAEQQQFALDWQQQRQLNKRTYISPVKLFEIQAGAFSKKTALVFEQQSLSYRELNERANRLAQLLQKHSLGDGDKVGIYLERSIDLVVSILAVLKTGAAYIPLDPYSPDERVNFIIDDAGIDYVICADQPTRLAGVQCLALEALADALANESGDNLNVHIPIDAAAYVIYTSGTTGKPKGCEVSHRNVARLFTVSDKVFAFDEHDVWTLFHSSAFDFSVWEIWGALLHGSKLVIVPYWLSRSPEAFHELLDQQHVTVLNQTPSAFSQLIAVDADKAANSLPDLRYVIFGGEALDFSALRQWAARHPLDNTALVNMYGITETTVHVTQHFIRENDLQRGRSIIGRPLADLHVYLLDSHDQPVPVGVAGEICISGPGVTRGYLNQPQLTAERFPPNPFVDDLPADIACLHGRIYRSGDLARRHENGELEYLGRIDHQVKIRGHRIELGEIETVLNGLAAVQESLVRVKDNSETGKRLVAWLLVNNAANIDSAMIRQQLKAVLPEYMIPSLFVPLTQWPLTTNGKIDVSALPLPQPGAAGQAYVAPRNDTELAICAIWSEVLGIEKVGVHDNFFDLGGHSLLATRVAAKIRSELDCELQLRMIFDHPTVAELALVVLEQEIDAQAIDDSDLAALLDELESDIDPEE